MTLMHELWIQPVTYYGTLNNLVVHDSMTAAIGQSHGDVSIVRLPVMLSCSYQVHVNLASGAMLLLCRLLAGPPTHLHKWWNSLLARAMMHSSRVSAPVISCSTPPPGAPPADCGQAGPSTGLCLME
jgi:hypothetical protein